MFYKTIDRLLKFIIFSIVASIVLLVIYSFYLHYSGGGITTIHIKETERWVSPGGKSSKFLVYTNEGVFENSDLLFIGKFNSADIENELINKKVCKIEYIGKRSRIFSIFPNIVKIDWCK